MTEPTPNDVLNTLLEQRVTDENLRASMGRLFLITTVAVPSTGDPSEPGGFAPLVMDHDSYQCMVALTSPAALKRVESMAQYALEMTGAHMIKDLNPSLGVVIDNGSSSAVFSPPFLQYLRDLPPATTT